MKKLRFGVVGCGNRSGIMDYLLDTVVDEFAKAAKGFEQKHKYYCVFPPFAAF